MWASLRRILLALLIVWLAVQAASWFFIGRHIQDYEARREAEGLALEAELKRPPPENEAFRAGRDAILKLRSTRSMDCPFREGDGYRGCTAALETVRAEEQAAGRAWAQANRPAHAYECQGAVWFQLGCREVYKADFAPGGLVFPELPLHATSADCFKELAAYQALDDAYHDAIGMPQAAASHRRRDGPGYEADCERRRGREQAAAQGPSN